MDGNSFIYFYFVRYKWNKNIRKKNYKIAIKIIGRMPVSLRDFPSPVESKIKHRYFTTCVGKPHFLCGKTTFL